MTFGIRVESQLVGAYASPRRSKVHDSSTIRLPLLKAIGSQELMNGRPLLSASIDLGFFLGVLKPAVLDRLLSLHQRLGADTIAFVQVCRGLGEKAARSEPPSTSIDVSSTASDAVSKERTLIDLRLAFSGVRFGLKADDVATTLLFEALALKGHVTNKHTSNVALLWRAKVEHFGLSLGHLGNSAVCEEAEPNRNHRSAYMVCDVDIQEIPATTSTNARLNLYLHGVHTVMHIAALSELSDLVRSWQADILVLREHRAAEVAEVKAQTTRILKTLETSEKPVRPEAPWFANRLFSMEITGLGIAIPLDESAEIDLRQSGAAATPALLFSIRVISFYNKRNETARFRLQQMALQFLDQSVYSPYFADSQF